MNRSVCTSSRLNTSLRAFSRAGFRGGFSACAFLFLLLLLASRAAYATTVTDLSDDASDTGSLRYAVNNASDGDTINFASNVVGTISTTSTLTISHSITITGPGAALLKVVRSGSTAGDVFDVGNGITVTINGISISSGTQGRGITNNSTSSTLVVNDCAFPNNAPSGNQSGGAIANQGALTVYDSVFVGNFAYLGGAIANGGTATVFGSTFSANQGASNGAAGAIYNIGSMTIENSTFFANSAANNGNAIYNVATLNIKASTFSDGIEDIINSGGTVTLANSIVTGSCDSCGTQSGINLIGSGASELGPLQYNGGFTPTVMPLPGSSDILSQGSNSGLSTDQRNFARSATGATDLGAVQTNYLMVTNRNDSGSGSLRDAMAAAITDGSGDIVFQSGLTGTITLVSSLPPISTGYLNIAGPGANKLTIDGAGNHQILDFSGTGQQINISGLTIADGNQNAGNAGGIQNSGALIAENVAFTGNGGDTGGAIYNDGTLVLENSTFSNNTATSGAGIANASTGKLVLANGTFNGNTANGGNGGALDNNGGVILVSSGTVSGNNSKNGGIGAGISNDSGTLVLTNSIVSANMNLQSGTEDDCSNCGTQSTAYNLIGSTTNLNLGALAYNGKNATLQTMLPLPGSVAIQAGDPTQALAGLDMDERGFPRLTGGNLDLGAAQTNYTAVQFLQQPTNTIVNANINPAVTVEVLETNTTSNATDTVDGIPITLTLSGSGTLSGGTPAQTTSGGVATFANLAVDTANTGDTLATAPIAVSSGLTLPTVTSNTFDITLITTTVSFNPGLPTSVTYGDAPLTLKANAYASGTPTNQTLSFQVDSGPATVSGNVLTITGVGTIVVEVDAAANNTYAASDTTASITVSQANLTVTAANASRAYGAANPIFTGTYVGAKNGDTFSVSGTTTATATSGVGSYPITPTATGTNLADYSVTYVSGTLAVSQANLTVTATNATRVYGTPNPAFSGAVTGAQNGDTFTENFSTSATQNSNVGTYAIVPTVAGTDLADYSVTAGDGTLTVTQAVSKLTLTASGDQAGAGLPVTLTATATSTTTGIPTGTVTFLDGSSQLGTAPLNAQGVATLTVSTLPIGSNIATAGYAGDINFTGSQAQISSAIVVAPSTFTMTGTTSSLAIEPGQAATLTLTLSPAFGYNGTVTFSCSGLPANSQCSFQPSSIVLSGSTPVSVPVVIEIGPLGLQKSHTARLRRSNPLHQLPLLLPAVIFWWPGTELNLGEKSKSSKRKKKSGRMLLLIAILTFSVGLLGLGGCAGLSPFSSGNPVAGVQTVTMTATGSGGVTQSFAVQVTVE